MILIENIKYACQKCIKGHRSSRCDHTERALFIIRRKGRPISQCDECREQRKKRQVHQKCVCPRSNNSSNSYSSTSKKEQQFKKYIVTVTSDSSSNSSSPSSSPTSSMQDFNSTRQAMSIEALLL